MQKNDLEYAKAQFSAQKFDGVVQLLRTILLAVAGLVGIWLVFDGLHKVIAGQTPDGISAFAKVVEALNLGSVLGYIWGGGATIGWMRERKGKKRAIGEKSRFQKLAEKNDPGRSSSGLTETGDTPVEIGG